MSLRPRLAHLSLLMTAALVVAAMSHRPEAMARANENDDEKVEFDDLPKKVHDTIAKAIKDKYPDADLPREATKSGTGADATYTLTITDDGKKIPLTFDAKGNLQAAARGEKFELDDLPKKVHDEIEKTIKGSAERYARLTGKKWEYALPKEGTKYGEGDDATYAIEILDANREKLLLTFDARGQLVRNSAKNTPRPGGSQNATSARDIDAYVLGLKYDVDKVLAKDPNADGKSKLAEDRGDTEKFEGVKLIVIREKEYSLSKNLDGITILGPTHGIVYPGALLKANENLVKGTPDGVPQLQKGNRRGVVLTIDLPHFSEFPKVDRKTKGIIIENPTHAEVSHAIDEFLEWFFEQKFDDVPAAKMEMTHTVVHSEEQALLELGININSGANKLKSSFKLNTSQEKTVSVVKFQQTFFTVSINQPADPSDLIGDGTTPEQLRSTFDGDSPPCYVQSVAYGRTVMVKLETDKSKKDIEGKLAFEALKGKIAGNLSAASRSLLENSSAQVVILGGDAKTGAALVLDPRNSDELATHVTEGAVMSSTNRGVPMGYSVFFLKDNKLATMGYQTKYTTVERDVYDTGKVRFCNDSWVKFTVEMRWEYLDATGWHPETWKRDLARGSVEQIELGAKVRNLDFKIHVHGRVGPVWAHNRNSGELIGEMATRDRNGAPAVRKNVRVWGTLYKERWNITNLDR